VPAGVTALVMKAEPGAELACRARGHRFAQDGREVERGVISYYAAGTLGSATTMASWLDAIERAAALDVAAGRLAPLYRPALQVIGDGAARVPGTPH
jgi:hypothetical protein